MGATPGRKGERGLVDKTIYATEPTYSPPPASACDPPEVFRINLTDRDELVVRMVHYRGKVVDFAIMQVSVDDEGEDQHVARIDCCRGSIHRHQYDQHGTDVYDHRVIQAIPYRGGWDVVDRGYADAYDTLFNEWECNLRRWQGE